MLRPSHYDRKTGLWVWTPIYDDNEDDEQGKSHENEEVEENVFEMDIGSQIRFKVKAINFTQVTNTAKGVQATTISTTSQSQLHPHASSFPLTDSVSSGICGKSISGESTDISGNDCRSCINVPVSKQSLSVDLSDSNKVPASMHITASICEDGLGLISWWSNEEDELEFEYTHQ
jgi:DNA-directed RNA polymerase subunit E'/Rpb7